MLKYQTLDSGGVQIVDTETGFIEESAWPELVFAHKNATEFLSESDFTYLGNGFGADISRNVWCYWAQGFDNAPAIVKSCVEQVKRRNQDRDVVLLDDTNLRDHIDIPDFIADKKNISKAHFSDVVRVALLRKHGGAWIDATCLSNMSVSNLSRIVFSHDVSEGFQRSKFFAFTSGNFLSNWFLMSSSDHVIPTIMHEYLMWYWAKHEKAHHYFMFHLAFRALYFQNASFRRAWDRTVRLSSKSAHILQKNLSGKFHAPTYRHLLNASPIHKLTYKTKLDDNDVETFWGHICQNTNKQ